MQYYLVKPPNMEDATLRRLKKAVKDLSRLRVSPVADPNLTHFDPGLPTSDSILYVCDPFSGTLYVNLLQHGCRIVGPAYLSWHVSKAISLPADRAGAPLYSNIMANLIVCSSSLETSYKRKLFEMISHMGGTTEGLFTTATTHLVAGDNQSEKYRTAVQRRVPVVRPDWVEICYEKCVTDPLFDPIEASLIRETSIAPLENCFVCVTGGNADERAKIDDLVRANGGRYSADLVRSVTHLITFKADGPKYTEALKWNTVHAVSPRWFYDSINAKGRQNEALYPASRAQSAFDSENSSSPRPPHTAGRILADGQVSATQFQRSNSTTSPGKAPMRMKDWFNASSSGVKPIFRDEIVEETRDCDFGISTIPSNTTNCSFANVRSNSDILYLDGCTIYLHNLSEATAGRMRRVIDEGGGTRRERFDESVTHVIADLPTVETDKSLTQLLANIQPLPEVVRPMWLLDSKKRQAQASCIPFAIPFEFSDKIRREQPLDSLPKQQAGRLAPASAPAPSAISGGLFEKCVFYLTGFTQSMHKSMVSVIATEGGDVAEAPTKLVTHVIAPFHCQIRNIPSLLAKVPVFTELWIERCVQQQVFHQQVACVLFKPLSYNLPLAEFASVNVCVSQYEGVERDQLQRLVNLLGGKCEFTFLRNKSTHLVSASYEGAKVTKARDWNIPIVSIEWVYACARFGSKVGVEEFLLTPNVIPTAEPPKKRLLAPEPASSSVSSPKRQKQLGISDTQATLFSQRPQARSPVAMVNEFYASTKPKVSRKAPTINGPLAGVSLFISKKLLQQFQELYDIGTTLGASVLPSYTSTCTHLLYAGGSNDKNVDFREAKADGKFIVSPEWLKQCQAKHTRLAEHLYPHTFNASRALNCLQSQAVTTSVKKEITSRPLHKLSATSGSNSSSPVSQAICYAANPDMLHPKSEFDALPQSERSPAPNQPSEQMAAVPEPSKLAAPTGASANTENLPPVLTAPVFPVVTSNASIDDSTTPTNPQATAGMSNLDFLLNVVQSTSKKKSTRSNVGKRSFEQSANTMEMSRALPLTIFVNGGSMNDTDEDVTLEDPDRVDRMQIELSVKAAAETVEPSTVRPASSRSKMIDEDDGDSKAHTIPTLPVRSNVKRFLLSSMDQVTKDEQTRVIEQLGGEVLTVSHFDATCTHVVVGSLSRSEKCLAAIASGRWVLKVSFLRASKLAAGFVDETDHEWNSADETESTNGLAAACRYWREKLGFNLFFQMYGSVNVKAAYDGWVVLLCVDKGSREGFTRLLEAGGARVLSASFPFSSELIAAANIAFVDLSRSKLTLEHPDIQQLLRANDLDVLDPQYIADYLSNPLGHTDLDHSHFRIDRPTEM